MKAEAFGVRSWFHVTATGLSIAAVIVASVTIEMDSVTASEVVQEAKITQVLIHLRRSLTSDWAALNGVFAADSMACRRLPR